MTGALRVAALLWLLAGASPVFSQEGEPQFEIGARYWLSTGTTRHSHNAQGADPGLGNPTSILTYENLDASTFELYGRIGDGAWFLKALIGGGHINRGSFHDEDFNAGQVKFSDTTSSVPDGTISYGVVDFGRAAFFRSGSGLRLDAFVGYTQWTEFVDAYGATDHLGAIGGDIDRSVKVISNEITWRGMRLGAGVDWAFASKGRLVADAAWVLARVKNEDSHHLRTSPSDLGPAPNIIIDGNGTGVQLDFEARYTIARGTEVGAGFRYWYLKATDGNRKAAGTTLPIVEIWSERIGLTLTLVSRW